MKRKEHMVRNAVMRCDCLLDHVVDLLQATEARCILVTAIACVWCPKKCL